MPWVVIAILAVVWAVFLVPQLIRARRAREDALGPPLLGPRVTIERYQPRFAIPGFLLAGLGAAGFGAWVGDVALVVASVVLLAVGVVLWQSRSDEPAVVADERGLRMPGRGQLTWDEIECLVPFGSQLELVARRGAVPIRCGRAQRWLQRIDRAATGYDVWGILPTGRDPVQSGRLVELITSRGILIVEPRRGAVRRLVQVVVWIIAP